MKTSLSLTAILGIATLALALPAAAPAQTVEDDSVPDVGLDIPGGQTFFGTSDPNVRTATAIVNGEIITGTDVDQRLALAVAAHQQPPGEEELQRLRTRVLSNLIDETLQIQEAEANEINISEAQVDSTFAQVAQQNGGYSVDDFETYLRRRGSSPASLKRQIKGELAWSQLLRRNVQPFINVGEEEVNAIIERLNAAKGSTEYRLGEIFLSATARNDAEVEANVRRIMEQIRQGGSFVAYASQFSEASTAAVGGDLGWVRLGQLPPSLAQAAREMSVGQIQAIKVPGGYSILYMIDQRQVLSSDPRDSILSLKQLSVEIPAGTSEARAATLVQNFAVSTQRIRGCGEANEVASQLGADIVERDGIRARDLPPVLQQALLQLQVGQSTRPYGSMEEGVRVFVLCGRDDPAADNAPSFDQIMSQLENERVDKRARLYLRDLRNDAIIEYSSRLASQGS